jgi:hypothetical protein
MHGLAGCGLGRAYPGCVSSATNMGFLRAPKILENANARSLASSTHHSEHDFAIHHGFLMRPDI